MKNPISSILFLAATLVFACSPASAQESTAPKITVQDLKTHGLIIWLPDAKRRIELLKSNGQLKQAAKEQAKIARQNRELVGYYKAHFNFCKVSFYHTSLEEDLKNSLPVLLNDDLLTDASIPLPEKVIIGGFFWKPGQEHLTFPTRHFRVENADIKMNLRTESWRPFWIKKPTHERDVIRLNKMLTRMAGNLR